MTPRTLAAACIILGFAAWLRLANLADRPMHADEAIFAYKLGTLLESGSWTYEPGEYHGPVLHYLTAAVAWLCGARNHRDLSETILRAVPASIGILTVFTPFLFVRRLGSVAALAASALLAVSPAMVYYSRYYIPEMLQICLAACLLFVVYRYSGAPSFGLALAAGSIAGLMFATKETTVITLCAAAPAAFFGLRIRRADWKHVLAALAAAALLVTLLLGARDTVSSISLYAGRAFRGDLHVHPWYYYFHLLLGWSVSGGPVWSEAAILLAVGLALAFRGKSDAGLSRFLAVYTVILAVLYSLIPYKTPWCLLGFLYGFAILAGNGIATLTRVSHRWMRITAYGLVALAGLHLASQAFRATRQYSADPRNPYAYAHTSRDIYAISDRLRDLSTQDLRVQVISSHNVWPLPWYLRDLARVEWRRVVTSDMKPAPVILATPDVEPALLHHLYEVMPPGERPLYVPLFEDHMELRPGFELRGYVQQSVLAAAQR